jgi:hypothetical protein
MGVDTRQSALRYLAHGWSVIPVRSRDKQPLVRWQPYQERAADAAQIDAWLACWPDANLAVVTGAVSGLVALDIDPKHGGDQSLERWQRHYGRLPATVEANTGGGGRHVYFAYPGTPVRNRAGLAAGIDVRADGGYVVVPPSVHPNGRRYAWVAGHEPGALPLAVLPPWLLRVLAGSRRSGHPPEHWRRLVHEGVVEGERNTSIASLTGHLLWHGVDPEVTLELLLCWNRVRCRPPLDPDEVAHTVESIVRLHQHSVDDA